MEALEKRQHVIIEQLKELKAKLLGMQKNLNVPKVAAQLDTKSAKTAKVEQKPINVSISRLLL